MSAAQPGKVRANSGEEEYGVWADLGAAHAQGRVFCAEACFGQKELPARQPRWVFSQQQVEGAARPIGLHGRIEAFECGLAWIGLAADPADCQADAQAPKHRQIPSGIGCTDTALVFQGDHIQSLMQTVLDAPVSAFIVEQRARVVVLRVMRCEQEELFEGSRRFGGIVNRLLEFGGLPHEGKARLLGADFKPRDGPRFRATFVQFRTLRQVRCRRLRGKTRRAPRATTVSMFRPGLFGCL